MSHYEPLMEENKDRFVIFPVKHNDIWDWYKKSQACYWTVEEIDFQQDLSYWNSKLSIEERNQLKNILAILTLSKGTVNKLSNNILNVVQYPEVKFFYGFQHTMENIHSEAYSQLLNTYIQDDREKIRLLEAVKIIPAIKRKADWASKWMKSNSFAEKLVALAAAKGIFFSTAFCSIACLKERDLMPGLTISNELISRDTRLHSDFVVHLYKHHLVNKISKEKIREILIDAHNIEREFMTYSVPINPIGINTKLMLQYLEYVTDILLEKLDCNKEYNTSNPFKFMDLSNIQGKTRIFEKRVSELKKVGVQNKDKKSDEINLDADL